jgi:uncharacterized membrane protein YczE
MNPKLRTLIHVVVLLMGLALMIGGIVTGKHGATVVGVIVSGVSVQQWMKWTRKRSQVQKDQTGS